MLKLFPNSFLIAIYLAMSNVQAFEEEDRKCLALNIYHEARGEPESGKHLVGIVTMNRVFNDGFPNTICEVVWARNKKAAAFSWTWDGKSDTPHEERSWQEARDIATLILFYYHLDPIGYLEITGIPRGYEKALYYHRIDINPYWADSDSILPAVGNHVAYTRARRK